MDLVNRIGTEGRSKLIKVGLGTVLKYTVLPLETVPENGFYSRSL